MNNDYFRAFVALTEEQTGFSLAGKKAFGKAIIETRGADGKLLVSAQGLKPTVLYKIYLVAKNIGAPTSRFSGVLMGSLPVNDKGVAETKILFDANSVGESGFMVGLFSAVAIIVHNAPILTAPLVGYVSEPVFWKNGFEFFEKKDGTVVVKQDAEELAKDDMTDEEPGREEPFKEEPAKQDVLDEPNVHEKFRDYVRSYQENTDVLPVLEEPEKPHISETKETQLLAEEPSTFAAADLVNELFQKNAKMTPFTRRDPNIEWIRIAPEHAALIGLHDMVESSLVADSFRRYRHLILGRVPGSRYILGIPDMYTLQTAATAESKGFAFKRCDGGEVSENSYGYWIMVV